MKLPALILACILIAASLSAGIIHVDAANCVVLDNWGELAGAAYLCYAAANNYFSKYVFEGN